MGSFDEIRQQLRSRLADLEARQGKVEQDLRRAGNRDAEEQALEIENDEVLEGLEERGREEIGQIRRALARIESGRYGTCERCGEEIGRQRLGAVPYTTLCVDCAA